MADSQAASGIRSSIGDATDRISKLDTERHSLEQVLDELEIHQGDLLRRVQDMRDRVSELENRLKGCLRRDDDVAQQADLLRLEVETLEHQCETRVRRSERLKSEASALAGDAKHSKTNNAAVDTRLSTIRESLRSMDRRLTFAREKTTKPRRKG